jgi:hypothetical protein
VPGPSGHVEGRRRRCEGAVRLGVFF